jgi:hypothetical protein
MQSVAANKARISGLIPECKTLRGRNGVSAVFGVSGVWSLESGEDTWPTILAVEGRDEARLFEDERFWRTRTRIPESREPCACGMESFTVAVKLEVLVGTWSLGGSLLPNTHGGVVEAARASLRCLIWVRQPSTASPAKRSCREIGDEKPL